MSKPLSAAEYVAGKLAILFVFLIFVTWAPAMGLLLVQAIFAGSFTFIRNNAYLLPAITLFSLAQVLLASTTMLALSSLSKSSRFVGVMYAGLMFFTAALFQALRGITGSTAFAWMSPGASLEQLGDVIFRIEPRYDLSPAARGADGHRAHRRVGVRPRSPREGRGDRDVNATTGAVGPGVGNAEPGATGAVDMPSDRRSLTPLVQAEHLSKWYGQVSGLNDVTSPSRPASPDCSARTAPARARS